MAPGFDGSVHEILATLSFGGTLVLRKRDNDPFSHLTDVDVALLNPSVVAHMSPVDYPNLQQANEPLGAFSTTFTVQLRFADPQYLLMSEAKQLTYILQTTVAVCLQRLHEKVPVNIGPPFPTVRIYILNDHLELQPPGTPGNIYIAGVQVGPGYLDMPDVTESEYRQDPFATWSEEERMYRTGDLGFWDELGNIHCCGRKDRQVKLGGYRINLETIAEVALQQMPQIRACVATVERQRIVLWLEPEDVSVSKLHQRLRTYLPPYAVPKMIRPIKSIPVNTYGKLDIKSLASWQEEETMELVLPGPDRGLQQALANEWRLLLKLSPSVELTGLDSFMLHGGDSLLQLALAARIQKIFGIVVTPKDIIEAKSLDDMVTLIESRCDRNGSKVGELQTSSLGLQRLSSAEIWWLYRYRNSMCQSGFNVPYVANLSASIDRERLVSALKTVLNRHRILRSRFLVNGEAAHRVISDTEIDVPMVSSVDIPAFINHPFNLSEYGLVRAVITPACLVLNISHIVCDLTLLKAIFRETGELYYGRVLPPVSREYFDTTMWSRPIDVDTAQFWTEELGDLDLNILREREKLLVHSYRGTSLVTTIPMNIYQKLIASTKKSGVTLHQKSGVTLHQTGLAVTALVLHVLSNKENIVVAAPFINRFSSEDQGVVGLFLEPLPVRVRLKDLHRSISSLLDTSTLVDHLGLSAQTDSPQIFDCAVTFHDDRVFTESLPIDGVSAQNV
ncbi:acetyl-CoA synthetase-like protein [Penicillium freii]|nr:acetyl-CoA synthetase-like protein [Penicillium freii]